MLLMLSDKKAQTEKKSKHDFITLMLSKQIQMHLMEVYDSHVTISSQIYAKTQRTHAMSS